MISKFLDYLQLKILWKSPERAFRIYEWVPDSILNGFRLANLKKTLKLAKKQSIFYREKFASSDVDINKITSPEDLKSLYTTPEDLQTRPLSHFTCGRAETAFETTGTISKTSKRILFSNREIEDAGRAGASGMWSLGITKQDRVASSFDYSFWVSGPTLKCSLTELGAFHIEAGRIDPEEFYERIQPYGCNVIVADPGWMVRLSEIAEKRGPWLMKLILIGGENLSESARKYMEKVWQCKVLLTYGQTEAFGMIGVECSEQEGYHLNDMDLWAEIADPDENGYGELVYTTLRRTVMPLIRYRSGDITRFIQEPCRCGVRSMRLAKLRGRVDEMVVTGVGNIAAWMIGAIIDDFDPQIQEWQLAVRRNHNHDLLELRAELTHPISEQDLQERFMKAMKDKMDVAYQGIVRGMAELHVKIYEPGKLKGDQRKIKRVIDERDFSKS